MDVEQFQEDKTINPNQLDLECALQPERFFRWAEACAQASFEVDKAKLNVDVTKAQLDRDCRQDPTSFGLVKATEGAVDAAVKCSGAYLEALDRLNNARSDYQLLQAAVTTMDHKKRMLELLVTLHGQQYFAGPSVPRDLVADWMERQKQTEETINQKQKNKTRKRGEKE